MKIDCKTNSIIFGIVICAVMAGCSKSDNGNNQVITQLPLLTKILDSVISTQKEDRIFYYYNLAGLCDSSVYEPQLFSPGLPPTWAHSRLRFEYNVDSLPVRAYQKNGTAPEGLYAEMEYNTAGKLIRQSIQSDTFKFTYDAAGRLVRDTQFNVFGIWQFIHTYKYDANGNVVQYKAFSAHSPDSTFVTSTYDSAINPLYATWLLIPPHPVSLSPNNVTSISYLPVPNYAIITYQYNSYNLPIRASSQYAGLPEPRIRTYVYQ